MWGKVNKLSRTMELIPIIKYALTAVSLLSVVIIAVSYIMYKIKSGKKLSEADSSYTLVPAGNSSLTTKLPANSLFDEKIYSQKGPVKQAKIQMSAKKSVKRFMVVNANQEPYRFNQEKPLRTQLPDISEKNSRQGLNIYSSYSSNSSEPLKKFGL